MEIRFYKFHGNGNDFIIVDNRTNEVKPVSLQIQKLCDRKFGIGADGLILLNASPMFNFEMVYYNSDGKIGSMCGNGGRCISAFAKYLGIVENKIIFQAIDGTHNAVIIDKNINDKAWNVKLQLKDVATVERNDDYYYLDTGSPHYVKFVEKVAEIDVVGEGRRTRYSEKFVPNGTNVNFVEKTKDGIFVRTYERGVEEETLSCGTGATASAIAYFYESGNNNVKIHTTGGDFVVKFNHQMKYGNHQFTDIWLQGSAILVFEGDITI